MEDKNRLKSQGLIQRYRNFKRWQKVVSTLACLVVFCTTYALILPALTLEGKTYCGREEHVQHEASCYTVTEELVCGQEEASGHHHGESCYKLVDHKVCGKEESAGHQHSDDCYKENKHLTCGKEETAGHSHDESCYDEDGNLVCELQESAGHQHDDSCYSIERELICGKAESSGHKHSQECYETEKVLVCDKQEASGHKHDDSCYKKTEELTCKKEIHQHSKLCYSDPNADLEVAADWEKTMKDVELTGVWADDVLAIADSQLGYKESTKNYDVDEKGKTLGYTRYGQWYGVKYGHWCAMYVSFCLNYAGVDQKLLPYDASCQNWIDTLSSKDYKLYRDNEEYTPKPGDLIFFDWDSYEKEEDRHSEHIGLVYELIYEEQEVGDKVEETLVKIKTIEGNANDEVKYMTYKIDDDRIMGYGELPENPHPEIIGNPDAPVGRIKVIEEDETAESSETETAEEETSSEQASEEVEETETAEVEETEESSVEATEEETASAESESLEAETSKTESLAVEESETESLEETAEVETSEEETSEEETSEEAKQEDIVRRYEGPDYVVTVTYTAEAQIPAEAELNVREIKQDSEEYNRLCGQASEALDVENLQDADETEGRKIEDVFVDPDADVVEDDGNAETKLVEGIVFARFFDIGFMIGSEKIEPQTAVNISISYKDTVALGEDSQAAVVHFADKGIEVLEVETSLEEEASKPEDTVKEETSTSTEEETKVSEEETEKENVSNEVNTFVFTQESFSITGTVVTGATVPAGEYIIYTQSGDSYYALSRSGEVVEVTVNNGVVTCNDDGRTDIIWNCTTNADGTMTINNGEGSNKVYLSLTGQRAGTYWGVDYITNLTSSTESTVRAQAVNNRGFYLSSTEYSLYYMGNNYERFTGSANQNYHAEMRFASYVAPSEEDGSGQTSYYRRVSSIESGKDYLIVSVEGNYALTATSKTNVGATSMKLIPVKGKPGIYQIDGVENKMLWNFPGATGGSTATSYVRVQGNYNNLRLSSANGYDLALDDTSRKNNYANLLTYNPNINSWTIRRSGNDYVAYLTMNNNSFDRNQNTSYRNNMLIMEKVDPPSIPPDPTGTSSGSGGSESIEIPKPTYPEYNSVSSAKEEGTSIIDKNGDAVNGTAYSDPATSKLEERFDGTDGDDGKVLADKSVIYQHDDYGAFMDYEENSFGVTLSLLGQEYAVDEVEQVKTPIDVVFVLDVSGSMSNSTGNGTRRTELVEAVNKSITQIREKNTENRVGVVLYSSGSWDLLDLDYYDAGHTAKDKDNQEYGVYLEIYNNNIRSASDLKYKDESRVPQTNIADQPHGTYTQSGIARGAAMFERVTNTTYTTTIGSGDNPRTVTVERQPVTILLSDGDPTHCTSNYTDVLSGPHYGSGVYAVNNNDTTSPNNKGIQGYYTILSANYYKGAISRHYKIPSLFYTVGMGIYESGVGDLTYDLNGGRSATGDHYKRAVLNPTSATIRELANTSAFNYEPTAHQLRDLLNNSFSDQYVRVDTTSSYSQLGTTNRNVPVVPNPYSNYSYADGAYFGNLDGDKLTSIFNGIIQDSIRIKKYGFILVKRSSAEIVDPIGDGMEITSDDLVLSYGGINYHPTSKTVSGNVTTYEYAHKYEATDGSGFSADLKQIKVTVTKDTDGNQTHQTVKLEVPDNVLPVYAPCVVDGNNWYYEALPVRLIYQVGLTEESKEAIQNMNSGQSLSFNTNRYDPEKPTNGAYGTIRPQDKNPYFKEDGPYKDYQNEKETNTTGTSPNSADVVRGEETYPGETAKTTIVHNYLGNNGKLEFSKKVTTADIKIVKTNMSGEKITSSPAEFKLYADADLTDQVGETYSTTDGEATITGLIIGNTYYLKETKSPDGYNILPEAVSFKIEDAEIKGIDPSNSYISVENGNELIIKIKNSDGYTLPETGGPGTKFYYTLGTLLLIGALMYGFSLRRKRERRYS